MARSTARRALPNLAAFVWMRECLRIATGGRAVFAMLCRAANGRGLPQQIDAAPG